MAGLSWDAQPYWFLQKFSIKRLVWFGYEQIQGQEPETGTIKAGSQIFLS